MKLWSDSWVNDFVPAGTSLQARCGLRLSEKVTPPRASGPPAAVVSGLPAA